MGTRAGACLGWRGSRRQKSGGSGGRGRGRALAWGIAAGTRRPEGQAPLRGQGRCVMGAQAKGTGPGGSRSAERGNLLSDHERPGSLGQEFVRMTRNH